MNTKKVLNKNLIFATIILILTLLILTGCETKILTRKATMNDINIDTSQELSLNVNYIMIPYSDIDNLELKFQYYDKDRKLVTTKTKTIGNIKEGTQYTISISFTEFNFFDLFKINYTSVSIVNGTVSLI